MLIIKMNGRVKCQSRRFDSPAKLQNTRKFGLPNLLQKTKQKICQISFELHYNVKKVLEKNLSKSENFVVLMAETKFF